MVNISPAARKVRMFILDTFVASGRAPNVGQISAALGIPRDAVLDAFRDISTIDTFWVEKGTENVRILSPFSDLTTPYKVTVDGQQRWHAVCGIEALGLWVFFPGKEVSVDSYCRDCAEPIQLRMRDGALLSQIPEGIVAHLGVPVAHWFDDLPFA